MIAGVLLWLLWRGRLPRRWIVPIAIAALLASAPYYLPLAAVVPRAGLILLGAIEQPFVRAILLVFLIAGPVVFLLFGAPLG